MGTVDVPLIYKKSLDYHPLWQGDITWKTYEPKHRRDGLACMDTVKQIVKSQKNTKLIHHAAPCHSHFLLFHIVSLQQYYLAFWCLTGKNNVAQQDLHLCQYPSPKKCPDMNLSVTVTITITTWFKKCLSSKLSIADDEKSAFSIFIMLHFLHSIINTTFVCMHTHRNVIKCFYLVPLLFQESTFLELFPKRTNEGKV